MKAREDGRHVSGGGDLDEAVGEAAYADLQGAHERTGDGVHVVRDHRLGSPIAPELGPCGGTTLGHSQAEGVRRQAPQSELQSENEESHQRRKDQDDLDRLGTGVARTTAARDAVDLPAAGREVGRRSRGRLAHGAPDI
jgi:hypothetical protein